VFARQLLAKLPGNQEQRRRSRLCQPRGLKPGANLLQEVRPEKRGRSIVRFYIPSALREFAGGQSQIEIEHPAATLNSVLNALWTTCPGMRDRVVTEQGEVRRHINIFVGEENIRYTGGLATRVSAESVISIVPAVSGGSTRMGPGSTPRAIWLIAGRRRTPARSASAQNVFRTSMRNISP